MVEFVDITAAARWLEDLQPAKRPDDVSVALAARPALRVLPLLITGRGRERVKATNLVLTVFRASALAWIGAKYSVKGDSFHSNAVAADVSLTSVMSSVEGADGVSAHVRLVLLAVLAALRAAQSNAVAFETGFPVKSAINAIRDAFGAYAAFLGATTARSGFVSVDDDATMIDRGATGPEVAGHSLWPNGSPNWASDSWRQLKIALLGAGEGWEVWTDWYEARLAGDAAQPPNEALEIARATIPDEIWEQGPAVVNAEIKRLIAEHAGPPPQTQYDTSLPPVGPGGNPDLLTATVPGNPSASEAAAMTPEAASLALSLTTPDIEAIIPPQVGGGSHFKLDESGRIALVPDPPANADERQRELYDELRHKARELSGLGHNQLADLSTAIDRFSEALPDNIEAVSITRLWSRGNTLRRRLDAHELAVGSAEPSDPARLTPLVAEQLRDLVETFNVFILGEPNALDLERVRLGPQGRDALRAIVNVAEPIARAVQASIDVATPAAAQALSEQIDAARDALSVTGVNSDQAAELGAKTSRNFVAALLRVVATWIRKESEFAAKEFRAGNYRWSGPAWIASGQLPSTVTFIVDRAAELKLFVDAAFHNPALGHIIDVIVQAATSATPPI